MMARPFLSQVPDKDKSVKHLTRFGRGGGLNSGLVHHYLPHLIYTIVYICCFDIRKNLPKLAVVYTTYPLPRTKKKTKNH